MSDYAVFLRGVNVGGVTIKSADLRASFERLPVDNVRTLLASGNVVCSTALSLQDLRSAAETALRKDFGYEAWVVAIPADRLREIVDACPFPAADPATHTYITLFSDPAVLTELVDAAAAAGEPAEVLGPDAAAWSALKGRTLEGPLNKLTNKPRFKNATTTRNLRTLHKVLAALGR